MSPAGVPFRRVALVGVGLIGGSIGLGLKKRFGGAVDVVGTDPAAAAAAAVERGAVDRFTEQLAEACHEADLVVLAAPAGAITELLPRVRRNMRAGVIVTDVAGVKGPICAAGQEAARGHGTFIGGHPMAGAETAGLAAARADLFEGAAWALCPDPASPAEALDGLGVLVAGLGAHPVVIEADRHDRAVARISHLPQLVAVALLNLVAQDRAANDLRVLAGRGFLDLTRIGSSPFEPWRDVLAGNAEAVREAVDDLIGLLEAIRGKLEGRVDRLQVLFDDAASCRSRLTGSDGKEATC